MQTEPTERHVAPPRAVLFDMDGTLTRPLLDFPRIKAEMGIGSRPILEAMSEMSPEQRRTAEAVLARHESEAAERSTLNEGCHELLDQVHARGMAVALITRNSRASVKKVLEMHRLRFEVLVTREDAPYKPRPEPLLKACDRLGVSPSQAWMVGDGRYDVEAALAAGVRPVWLSHGQPPDFDALPWRTVRDLPELTRLLQSCLT